MKDAEFIELLNLYLDHEISAADAARLEAEVQRNPARRQTYRQYCQMQKACSMLTADFATESVSEKVIDFEPRRSAWRPANWGTAGLVAAAACAAFVVIGRNSDPATATQPVVASYTPPVVEPQAPRPAETSETRSIARTVVTTPAHRSELQPVFTATSLALGSNANQSAALPAADLEWIRTVQLVPMPQAPTTAELLRFDARPNLKAEPAVYRSNRPMQANVEMVGFEFKK